MAFDFKKLSVLIVEDTPPMSKLMTSILETMEVGTLYKAENGNTGFEEFKKHNPDIVLADWHMAPVDGIEFTQKVRTDATSPNRMVPVILITGYSATERAKEARDAGVTEVLVKPFTAGNLAKRLAYVINKPRDFIECGAYSGPDRRRKSSPDYKGPFKRKDDNRK